MSHFSTQGCVCVCVLVVVVVGEVWQNMPDAKATGAPLATSLQAQLPPLLLRTGLAGSGDSLSQSFQTPKLSKCQSNPTSRITLESFGSGKQYYCEMCLSLHQA